MEIESNSFWSPHISYGPKPLPREGKEKSSFKSIAGDDFSNIAIPQPFNDHPFHAPLPLPGGEDRTMSKLSRKRGISEYKNRENQYAAFKNMSGVEKYKDDQLLKSPGGDFYYLDREGSVIEKEDQKSFWARVGKDISDSVGNIKNLFGDVFYGRKVHYRDKDNRVQESKQKGIIGSVVDCIKDLGSALSFGMWRPDGEQEPRGFIKRCGFFFNKMKEAVFGDLIQGLGGSAVHIGEDLIFTGWNLIETIPDATIGNFEKGRKLTTAIFDNGQVVLDFLTDILPSGDAWVRVHSMKLKDLKPPVLNNITMPEYNEDDSRWKTVRNTSFRKSIETIGSIFTDILTLNILGNLRFFSEERHNRN